MANETITIVRTDGGATVYARGLMAEKLTWDETLGCVAALLIPARGQAFIPYLRTPMQLLLDDIRYFGLMEVFSGE